MEDKNNLVITRIVNAPVAKVWEAWIDPILVMQWWPPNNFTSPSAKIDFREGGVSLVCMRAPKEFGQDASEAGSPVSGKDTYSTWTYTNIVPLQSIDYIHDFADKDGNKMTPSQVGMPDDFPEHQRHVITFEDLGDGKTKVTFTQYDWGTKKMRPMAEEGLSQSLDKMAALFG